MAAELQSLTQRPPTQNSAPLKPLTELRSGGKRPESYVQKAIQAKFQHYHRKDEGAFKEIINVGWLINLFINGNQYPVRNPVTGAWGALPLTGQNANSDQRALNIMGKVKQTLLGKWENSNPDILIRPGRNLDICVSAAKAADTIHNYYERQFYNHWFTQQEGLMGMTFGTYIDRYRYDESKVSMSVIQDIFETGPVQFGGGIGYCADCEYYGNSDEYKGALGGEGPFSRSMCPRCHSTAVEVLDAPQGPLSSVSGQAKQQVGDLVCELLPLPACRFDLSKRPEESDWFIYRQTIPKGMVERVMGNVLIPQGSTDRDYGLDALKALGQQGQALSGYSAYGNLGRSAKENSEEVTFDEFWMSPDCYADIQLIGDEKTVEGATLPKGKLTDVFPDGLCAVGLNGMSVVLALYPEKHRDHIVSGTWFMQAATGAGRGLADTVEIQKQFNTMNNQAAAYMTSTYSPAIGYDNQIISGNRMKYIGTPRTNIPFDLTKLPEGRGMKDAIFQFQPVAMPGQFFNYSQNFLIMLAKAASMAMDFENAEPGVASTNPTATAAEIDQGNADAINEPIFLIKGDCRKRGAEITITQFRKHFPMKRYFDLGGKYGEEQGIELSAADIQADLSFELDKASVLPKGPVVRRKNRMAFYNVVGGMEGVALGAQTNPRLLNDTAQEFGVELDINDYDAVAVLCRRRLDQMKQAVQIGVTDPQLLVTEAIQPPISAKELDLGQKSKWFASWLSTDEGLNSPMPLRAAAELLVDGFLGGQTTQDAEAALQQGTVQAAAMAPAAMGQAALDGQAEGESPDPDPTAALQAEQEVAVTQMELADKEKERAHEKEILETEGKRDKEVAKVDADQKIRIERSKPRPKPKPVVKGTKK